MPINPENANILELLFLLQGEPVDVRQEFYQRHKFHSPVAKHLQEIIESCLDGSGYFVNSGGARLTIEHEFEGESGEKVYWSLERDGESGMPGDPETGDDLEPTGVMNVSTKC